VHPNLKFVLAVQAAVITLCSVEETVGLAMKFVRQDASTIAPAELEAVDSFAMQMMMMLGHVLLLERVLATVMSRRYEQWRSPWFSVGWLISIVWI
jgi:hypothetical protein